MPDALPPARPATPAPHMVCPLCGGPNGCAPAASGSFDTPCWCRDVTFAETLLARIPPARRGMACICLACARTELPSVGR